MPTKEERGIVDFHQLPKRIVEQMIHHLRAHIKGFKNKERNLAWHPFHSVPKSQESYERGSKVKLYIR